MEISKYLYIQNIKIKYKKKLGPKWTGGAARSWAGLKRKEREDLSYID